MFWPREEVRESTCTTTCVSKLPEDRHHVARPVVTKLESLGVGFAFGVVKCIHVYTWAQFVVIKFGRGGRGLEPNLIDYVWKKIKSL